MKSVASLLLTIVLLTTEAGICLGRAEGTRYQLSTGQLFIPDYFIPTGDDFTLVFHLHGSPTYVEDYVYPCRLNLILISITLGSGSSAYSSFFADQQIFGILIDEALAVLQSHFPPLNPQVGFLCLAAWSAGYGGTRVILAVPDYFSMVDAVILEDGLHTSYINGNQVNPAQMVEFLAYAQAAVTGAKQFFFSHSQIPTYTYASTTETANYLIDHLDLNPLDFWGFNELGMEYESIAEAGSCAIHGFTGETAADHIDHVEALYLWLARIDFGAGPDLPAFPLSDSFPADGRELSWWLDRFTSPTIIPFQPVAPDGDGYVLRVMDPAGGVETTRIGNLLDENYTVECSIYCEYRPELASDGYERVGIFLRDNGNGCFDHSYAGGGYCYLMTWDSDTGRIRCLVSQGGQLTDLAPTTLNYPSSAWRKMSITAVDSTLSFYVDGVLVADALNTAFASGQCGIGYHEYFTTNTNMHGTRADNFYADSGTLPPTATPTQGPQPTASATPAATTTPQPSPTQPPLSIRVQLEMPAGFFTFGDLCSLTAHITNYSFPLSGIPFLVVLDVYGSYWFWRSWETSLDYELLDVPIGRTSIIVIDPFPWPDTGNASLDGLYFWSALTDPGMTYILGGADGLGSWRFGYGPLDNAY